MESVVLGETVVSETSLPYVIAEIGVNHEGSLSLARDLITAAHDAGANAAKFQTYKADLIAVRDSPAYWDTSKEQTATQHALFSKFDTFGPAEYESLAEHCAQVGIDFLSTPFDLGAVDLLDPLVPFFKVASADICNAPLLRRIASKGKPVILSTGASNVDEIERALRWLDEAGAPTVVLLHCILNYPTIDKNAHLRMLMGLRQAFPDRLVGYSDHTLPSSSMLSLTTAYSLGACVLEKHFTLDKSLPGNDHYHAMDPDDLRAAIAGLVKVREILGPTRYKEPLTTESPARRYARRSVVAVRTLEVGEILTEQDLVCKRPATGIGTEHWDDLIGRRISRTVAEDTPLAWDDLD